MLNSGESFFTVVGCMDGRVQWACARYGKEKFDARYPDTITEAGIVGVIANDPNSEFINNLKSKLLISIENHHSKGIMVDGHAKCAGNPIDNEAHKKDVLESVKFIKNLIEDKVPVVGVFVTEEDDNWEAYEI